MSVPVFLAAAEALQGDEILLDGPEGRHAATVRRLRPGERVDLTDGAGTVAECVVRDARKDALLLTVQSRYGVAPPRPRVIVAQGLPKGDRGELAVEMMTETGVDVIMPWSASRSVVRWKGDRAAKALARWRATAREAGKQSRRFHLPEVTEPVTSAELAERLREVAAHGLAVVLHEEAERPLSGLTPPPGGDVLLVIGPEGGIAGEELELFQAAGAVPAVLGPTILRTSTAGVAAAAVLLARCGRW